MSDSVAWCILAGFKITSVFSRIVYHIVESVCEFAASILQGYVYGEKKSVTFKVIKKRRKSNIRRTADEAGNVEEPETRNFACRSNEPVMTKSQDTTGHTLTISEQRFCFRGADKIVECNLRDARKVTISFDFYPCQNQSTAERVEIFDPSKHSASGHRTEENSNSSVKPELSTDPKQANGQLDESEKEAYISGLKCTEESKFSGKTTFKSDCIMQTQKNNLKQSSNNEEAIILNGTQYKVDSAAHSGAKKQTTSQMDEKQIAETLPQKKQDTSADIKKCGLIPTAKNLELEAPFHNESIPSLTITKKPGSDSAADKKPLIASTNDKIKHVLESVADENKMHVSKSEKEHATVSPVFKCKETMTQSTTNKDSIAAFPVNKNENLLECPVNEKSVTGTTADKKTIPAADIDNRSVPVTTTDNRPVLVSSTDKTPVSKPVSSELVPYKKSTFTKHSVPLVSEDKIPAVESVSDEKPVTLPASVIVPCKNTVPEPSATKDPVSEASVNMDTVPVVAASNMPVPKAVTNKKPVPELLSVHTTDEKPVLPSDAAKVPVPVETTSMGLEPTSHPDNMPAPEVNHDKKSLSVLPADKKLCTVSPTNKKLIPVLVTDKKPDLMPSTDNKPVLASTATKEPVPEAVANQKYVMASEADKKPTEMPTADKNSDPVSLTNKKPVSVPVADKKPITAPAADKKPAPAIVTDKVSVSDSSDKRCASASTSKPISVLHSAKEAVPATTVNRWIFSAAVPDKKSASGSSTDKKPVSETSDKRPVPSSAEDGSLPSAVTDKKPAPASIRGKKPIPKASEDKMPVQTSAEKGPLPAAVTGKTPAPSYTNKKSVSKTSEDKRPVPSSSTEKRFAPAEHHGKDGADLVSKVSPCDERISQMSECSGGIENESGVTKHSTDVSSVSQVYAEPENIESEAISNPSKDSDVVGANFCKAILEMEEDSHADPSLIKKLDAPGNTMDTDDSDENLNDDFYKMLEKGPPIVIAPDILLNPSSSLYDAGNSRQNAQNIGMNSKYIQDGWDDTDKYFYDYIIEREKEMGQFDPSAFNAFSTDKDKSKENDGNKSKDEGSRGELPTLHGGIVDKYNPMTDLPKYYDLIGVSDSKYVLVKSKIKCYKKREVVDNLETAGGANSADNPNSSSTAGHSKTAERRGRETGSANSAQDVRARRESSNEQLVHLKDYKETGARPRTYSRK